MKTFDTAMQYQFNHFNFRDYNLPYFLIIILQPMAEKWLNYSQNNRLVKS